MLQGFYVMKAAEVSESRQRSQVHEQAAEQAAGVLVGVRLTTYTAPSRSLCRTKKGLQPHLFSEYVSAPHSRSSTRSFLRIIAEIPEEEILVFCKIYRLAFRNAAGVIPTFLRNFSMK